MQIEVDELLIVCTVCPEIKIIAIKGIISVSAQQVGKTLPLLIEHVPIEEAAGLYQWRIFFGS